MALILNSTVSSALVYRVFSKHPRASRGLPSLSSDIPLLYHSIPSLTVSTLDGEYVVLDLTDSASDSRSTLATVSRASRVDEALILALFALLL